MTVADSIFMGLRLLGEKLVVNERQRRAKTKELLEMSERVVVLHEGKQAIRLAGHRRRAGLLRLFHSVVAGGGDAAGRHSPCSVCAETLNVDPQE